MENKEVVEAPEAPPKEEQMETDQTESQTTEKKEENKEEPAKENEENKSEPPANDLQLNGHEEKPKTGSFRLKVTGLPKFYPVNVSNRQINYIFLSCFFLF